MSIQKNALFAQNTDDWETPQDLFDALDDEFHFGIDVCASTENRKCLNFFDKNDDGLSKNWGGTELFGAILLMGKRSACGCRKHLLKPLKAIPQLCLFHQELIHNGFMIMCTRSRM